MDAQEHDQNQQSTSLLTGTLDESIIIQSADQDETKDVVSHGERKRIPIITPKKQELLDVCDSLFKKLLGNIK
jgi:hypothetical protein